MNKHKSTYRLIVNLAIVAAIVAYMVININNITQGVEDEEIERLNSSIERAAVTCFSIEGFYPGNIDYLVDNYGLVINEDKYHIFYETHGANLKPEVKVIRKGQ